MFPAHVLIVRRSKLYYTASGIITPIGGRPVHRLREDDEHMCSKHVEAWNKLIIKFSAPSWLILRYIEMHGQQNTNQKKKPIAYSAHSQVVCWRAAVADQNCILEHMKSRLNSGDAWYQDAGENLLSLLVRSKNVTMKVHNVIIVYRCIVMKYGLSYGVMNSGWYFLRRPCWKTVGCKREELSWTKGYNEELHKWYA